MQNLPPAGTRSSSSTHWWKRSRLHSAMDLDETPLGREINLGLKLKTTFHPHIIIFLLFYLWNMSFPFLFYRFCLLPPAANVSGCAMLSLLKLTQSRKCKILQWDEYQIVKTTILINPAHSSRTQLVIGFYRC